MAKTWILDTETKGTGAHIAPLEKGRGRGAAEPPLSLTRFTAPPRPASPPAPRLPRRFRVVDVMSSQVVADDVEAPEAIAALEELSKVIDARVYVREDDEERWRLLTLGETKALWRFRGGSGADRAGQQLRLG
jgi:hypothetical protein